MDKLDKAFDLINRIKKLASLCIDDNLLKVNRHMMKRNFSFDVIFNQSGRVEILVTILYGPFFENIHTYKESFACIDNIYDEKIQNILLHSLTFAGSPFYFKKGRFFKQLELAG